MIDWLIDWLNFIRFCFWRCLWLFLCVKYLWNRWTDLHQIHTEDVFGPSLGRVWRSRSKAKVTRNKTRHFLALLADCMHFVFGKTSLASSVVVVVVSIYEPYVFRHSVATLSAECCHCSLLPSAWTVGSCWQYVTSFGICHGGTCRLLWVTVKVARVWQRFEVELREETSRLKSERLVKETQISRLEMSVSEQADQINELQRQLRQVLITCQQRWRDRKLRSERWPPLINRK